MQQQYNRPACCPGTCCANSCWWDLYYVKKTFDAPFCDGYAKSCCLVDTGDQFSRIIDAIKPPLISDTIWRTLWKYLFIVPFFTIPLLTITTVLFVSMILFIACFMPPFVFMIASLPAIERWTVDGRRDPFAWIASSTTGQGYTHDYLKTDLNTPWIRCFLISLFLCCLGWFPAVIFNFIFIIYFIYCASGCNLFAS